MNMARSQIQNQYPRILGYHPEIAIKNHDETISIIKMDLPDFEPTDTILKSLANTFNVSTAGELIQSIKEKLKCNKFAASANDMIVINDVIDTSTEQTTIIEANQYIA
jgi:hypothetical protein